VSEILLVAGEISGDLHAAHLVAALRKMQPGLRFSGIAGPRLRAEGVEAIARSEDLAHMGLLEVIRELKSLRAIMKELLRQAAERRPALAILVDSPDFNLRLAAGLKKLGIPVLLYISPQLWAWRKGRVRKVRRLAREVLCILPFETAFYHEHGVPARYVGHPLVDEVCTSERDIPQRGLNPGNLALLPGSRAMEVRALLPAMLKALPMISSDLVSRAFLIMAPGMEAVFSEILSRWGGDERLKVVEGDERRAALAGCDLAWTASGTATLECALLGVPMIVGYHLKVVSYALARLLVNVPHVALVNLIAEKTLAPELIQGSWNSERLIQETLLLAGEGLKLQCEGLAAVRRALGSPGASENAANAVLEHLALPG